MRANCSLLLPLCILLGIVDLTFVSAWGTRGNEGHPRRKDRTHGLKVLFQGCGVIALLFIFILNFYKVVYYIGNTRPGRLFKRLVWENLMLPLRKYVRGENDKGGRKKMVVVNRGADAQYQEQVRMAQQVGGGNPQESKKEM